MKKYYYSNGQDRVGTLTLSELKSLGDLRPETLVWHAGLPSWTRADELPELSEFFVSSEPPPLPKVAGAPHAVRSPRVKSGIKRCYLFVGIALVSVLLLSGLFYYFVSNRAYSGGKGTAEKPYLISSPSDMEMLSVNVSNGHTYADTCFLLTRDLTGVDDTVTVIIGNANHSFAGIFDGGVHSIATSTAVHVSEIDYPFSGLFGSTGGAVIKNLTVIGEAVGTAKRPYLISSRADMEVLADKVNVGHRYKDTYFLLTRDLTGADDSITTVIGITEDLYFSGIFDGNGHCIDANINLSVKGRENQCVGIFGSAEGAVIKNLSVSGSITGCAETIGGICGYSGSTITIINCHNLAELFIMGDLPMVGGITGSAENGTISDCSNRGVISYSGSNGSFTGGICGISNGTITISNCHNLSKIHVWDGNSAVGGICGLFSGTISNCSNRGEIIIKGGNHTNSDLFMSGTGGISGFINGGTISNCYNMGRITSEGSNKPISVGGITSVCTGGTISNCYNAGEISVSAKNKVIGGSIAGIHVTGVIKNCFAANESMHGRGSRISYGRIVGQNNDGRIENCYALSSMLINNKPSGSGKVNGVSSISNCENS
jgi:hypothetical protein